MSLVAVVMAAGFSKRFHGDKLVFPICGVPAILRVINSLKDTGISDIRVVLRREEKRVEEMMLDNIVPIYNDNSEEGLASSLRLAAQAAIDSGKDLMTVLGDQPLVSPRSLSMLIHEFGKGEKRLISFSFNGNPVSPVIFARPYLQEIMKLKGDVGGKSILLRNKGDLTLLEFEDPWESEDIDTQDAAEKMNRHLGC
ncbi:MAG: nucleotidyltransferase family protein [Candidatus Thermoplasmatota archaeon]|nr:nucleotidyltransferase family protein [Candidatus Thermoplasmatota archaeon]